jgi:hypothetical protein
MLPEGSAVSAMIDTVLQMSDEEVDAMLLDFKNRSDA